MALYLVQHGKSLAKEVDPERGLSNEGINEVKQMAKTAGNSTFQVDRIAHSGKKRALQTADFFAEVLSPKEGCIEVSGVKPMDDVKACAATLEANKNLMLVGHLPFMEKLTSFLVAGRDDLCVLKFQNAGIVCLDKNEDNTWFIKWTIMPEIS